MQDNRYCLVLLLFFFIFADTPKVNFRHVANLIFNVYKKIKNLNATSNKKNAHFGVLNNKILNFKLLYYLTSPIDSL